MSTREVERGIFFGGEEIRKDGVWGIENLGRNRRQGRAWVRVQRTILTSSTAKSLKREATTARSLTLLPSKRAPSRLPFQLSAHLPIPQALLPVGGQTWMWGLWRTGAKLVEESEEPRARLKGPSTQS